MKKLLKLLLVVAPLLTDARLCAIITAPSQLAPEVKVVLTPHFNTKGITATVTDPNTQKVVNQIQRLSTDPVTFDKPGLNLEIANNTILTPLVINDPKNIPTITIKKDASNTNNFYYIDKVTVPSFNPTETLKPFVDALRKAIGDSDAVIYIEEFLFAEQDQFTINSKATIDKDRGLITYDNATFDHLSDKYVKDINQKTTTYLVGNGLPDGQNFKTIFDTRTQQGFNQANTEKLNVNEATKTNTSYKAELQALYTIARLKGITNPSTLNDSDKNTIKKAITDYLKLVGNSEPLPNDFLLQFNSIELQALKDIMASAEKDYLKTNKISEIDAAFNPFHKAVFKTTGMIDPLKKYRALQEDLANRLAFDQQQSGDGTAVIDWYMDLSEDDQLLMEYDIKAVYGQEHIVNMNPNLLNDAERAEVKIYIQDLLTRSQNAAKTADLQAKIKAIDAAQNLQNLQNKLQTYNDPKQENAMIDWLSTLSTAEQQSISEDAQAILVANTFNDVYNSNTLNDANASIKELMTLKQNLELFLNNDNDSATSAIFDKVIVNFTTKNGAITANLTETNAKDLVSNKIYECQKKITKKFIEYLDYDPKNLPKLLDPLLTNDYTQSFKELPLDLQKMIIDKINFTESYPTIAKANAELKAYQIETLPERIQEAGTTAELQALEDDVKKVNINLDANTEKLFSNKFSLVETAENEAIAKGEPFIPEAKPTDAIIFDSTTGQTDQIDPATGEVIPVPAGGTTDSADAAAEQAEIAQDDPDLAKQDKEEEAKEAAAEQARKDAAKDADNYNQEHAAEGVQEIK